MLATRISPERRFRALAGPDDCGDNPDVTMWSAVRRSRIFCLDIRD